MDAFSDGLGFQPRVKEPETSFPASQLPAGGLQPFLAPNMPDTSAPGPTALQEPAAWTYDFNPASGSSRANFNGEVTANSISSGASGVTSWNGETGVVVMTLADIENAGGAPIASPIFTGNPAAPTRLAGDSSGGLATTAFVQQAIAGNAGVTAFNGRSGAITLTTGDVTSAGGAPAASPALTGTPTAPTGAPGDTSSQIATDAFVGAAIAGQTVTAFNGRRGAVSLTLSDVMSVGGAPAASPTFTGVPAVPTAAPGTATTQAASTAFVTNAVAGSVVGVASFNTRTGAVVLTPADLASVGGAPLLSPTFTGTPHAPTPSAGDNSTALATTAFVDTAIGSLPSGVSTFNGRTGTVVLTLPDVTSVGGAPVASPTFTGSPITTTPAPGDNSGRIADTAFVAAAIGALPSPPAASATTPNMDGTASVGVDPGFSRGDHVHPTDTSRAAASALANYLPLTGGSLTGSISSTAGSVNFNSGTFTASLTCNTFTALGGIVVARASGAQAGTFYAQQAGGTQGAGFGFVTANGAAQMINYFQGGGWAQVQITPAFAINCTPFSPAGGAWSSSSDARLKDELGDYTTGLDEVLALRPILFRYKGNDAPPEAESVHKLIAEAQTIVVGLIAQEAEIPFPGMVTQRAGYIDGEPVEDIRDLNPSELVYALVNAVKTLAARVEALEAAA